MIEKCSDLPQCEAILSQAVGEVSLIGELEYSPQDIAHLAGLVRATINPDINRGTRYLEQKAPTCLACLLVWIGIEGYEGNTYWPAVQQRTGLSGPNWQSRWGSVFLDVLHAHNLPLFDIPGSTTYVTPILGHGGIPNACLPEFFEKVLHPLVERDLRNPGNAAEIVDELRLRRTTEEERVRIEAGLNRTTRAVEAWQLRLARAEGKLAIQQDQQRLESLEAKAAILVEAETLPADYAAFRTDLDSQLAALRQAAQLTEREQQACQSAIDTFSAKDRHILTLEDRIERAPDWWHTHNDTQQSLAVLAAQQAALQGQVNDTARKVLTADWQDRFGLILEALPFDDLRQAIERYTVLAGRCTQLTAAVINTRNRMSPAVGQSKVQHGSLRGLFRRLWALLFVKRTPDRQLKDSMVDLERTLVLARSERERQRQAIVNMLGGLPIRETELSDPGPATCTNLETLRDRYKAWAASENERQNLLEIQTHCEDQLHSLAGTAGLEIADTDRLIEALQTALQVAREHLQAADEASTNLSGQLSARLTELAKQQATLEDERRRVDDQLMVLGRGSLETGLVCLADARAAHTEAAALRADLQRRTAEMSALRQRVEEYSDTNIPIILATDVRTIREHLTEARQEQQRYKTEFEQAAGVWTGADEPIRRFLLYGGIAAEQFLVKTVQLYETYRTGASATTTAIDLPVRVLEAFDAWYQQSASQSNEQVVQTKNHAEIRPNTPCIYLDAELQTVMMHLPAQTLNHLPKAGALVLDVVDSGDAVRCERQPLRVYRSHGDAMQTQELDVALPFVVEAYRLLIRAGDAVYRSWDLPGLSMHHHLLFDGATGQLLPNDELPRKRVYLALHQDYRVAPDSTILDTFSLYGRWHEFAVFTVDPTDIHTLDVVHRRETSLSYSLVVSATSQGVFQLEGGIALQSVVSNLRPVYSTPPTAIRTPIRSTAELRFWRILMTTAGDLPADSFGFQLSELLAKGAVHLGEDGAVVDLSHDILLGPAPAGEFSVRLRRLPHQDWACEFVVLPGFGIEFEHPVYIPYPTNNAPDVHATVSLPSQGTIKVLRPSRKAGASATHLAVELSQGESVLLMEATFRHADVPLTATAPKIFWRLQGTGGPAEDRWHDQVVQEELWLGDWQAMNQLFLIVELPSGVHGRLNLRLDGDAARVDEQVIRQNSARFDLLAFRDAIRTGSPVREFLLDLNGPSTSFASAPLFRIRWQWEVSDVECIQESSGSFTLLTVTWQELGKTDGHTRLVRLWHADGDTSFPVAENRAPEGERRVQFRLHSSHLKPGSYLLHFVLEDPWQSSQVLRPELSGVNCHEIVIVHREETYEGRLIEIRTVYWSPSGRSFPPDPLAPGMYRIRIMGRIIINKQFPPVENSDGVLITRLNEGWFVGHLEVPHGKGLDDEMAAANPLKFEYDVANREITAIEDKGGDGAMYCRVCRLLFWSAERVANEDRQHKDYLKGPIEHFDVEWL